MQFWAGALVGALVAVVVAVGALALRRRATRQSTRIASDEVHPQLVAMVGMLKAGAMIVGRHDEVLHSNAAARTHGLARGDRIAVSEVLQLVRTARTQGANSTTDLELRRGHGAPLLHLTLRVAPLEGGIVVVLADDRTPLLRVDETRRDFVANVSHELKTPVGGIALLAEAVLDAADDPVAVRRFATRMGIEATRLTQLVKEVVDLSRLQAAEVLIDPELVDIEAVVDEALDNVRVTASAKDIALADKCGEDLYVLGDRGLLVTAVRNLVGNAISYSPDGTKVGVGARLVGDQIEITVTDQGPGIPQEEQGRIFERFYRIDEARSRATGGTGLGLSIVKHVCANHGGDVTVWSDEGQGSTFTIRLPAAQQSLAAAREQNEREPAR